MTFSNLSLAHGAHKESQSQGPDDSRDNPSRRRSRRGTRVEELKQRRIVELSRARRPRMKDRRRNEERSANQPHIGKETGKAPE
jgi:hypothetical protein